VLDNQAMPSEPPEEAQPAAPAWHAARIWAIPDCDSSDKTQTDACTGKIELES